MATKKIVLKYGGHAMDIPELREAFFKDLARLSAEGMEFVIVHGGGPQINNLLQRLHIESRFANGLRVTDDATLEVVEMALCGSVNKEVVRRMYAAGLLPCGISGEDGRLFTAEKINAELGRVGEIVAVNPEIVQCLLKDKFLPVIAPLALDGNNEVLNINADTAAGALAGALNADYFILVSDVPGVMNENKKLFSYLAESEIRSLIKSGVINGGMIPKVESCLAARKAGCKRAIIMDGRRENCLYDYLTSRYMAGTEIAL